jgi:hypothetical protein
LFALLAHACARLSTVHSCSISGAAATASKLQGLMYTHVTQGICSLPGFAFRHAEAVLDE